MAESAREQQEPTDVATGRRGRAFSWSFGLFRDLSYIMRNVSEMCGSAVRQCKTKKNRHVRVAASETVVICVPVTGGCYTRHACSASSAAILQVLYILSDHPSRCHHFCKSSNSRTESPFVVVPACDRSMKYIMCIRMYTYMHVHT